MTPCLSCHHNDSCCSRKDFPNIKLSILADEVEAYGEENVEATEIEGVFTNSTVGCVHKQKGLCTIHTGRPLECRIYPLVIDPTDAENIHLDPFCRYSPYLIRRLMTGDEVAITWIATMYEKAAAQPLYIQAQLGKLLKMGSTRITLTVPKSAIGCIDGIPEEPESF